MSMPTPYFENSMVQLFSGDCRDVLPQLPRASCHLIVTDPPYGVKWRSNWRGGHFDFIEGDDSTDAAVEALRLSLSLLVECRHIYMFGRYDLAGLPIRAQAELIWDKGSMSGGDLSLWGRQHEYIQFAISGYGVAQQGNQSARLRRGSILRFSRLLLDARHPTEKPVPLLRELIEMSSRIGETVLDPFAGVGSTLVAAQLEGRKAIGVEIEEKYCEIAARRLSQSVMSFEEPV